MFFDFEAALKSRHQEFKSEMLDTDAHMRTEKIAIAPITVKKQVVMSKLLERVFWPTLTGTGARVLERLRICALRSKVWLPIELSWRTPEA